MKSTQTDTRMAAAVARLMMGEFKSWDEFYNSRQISGPRRLRRAQTRHDRQALAPEVRRWCNQNFVSLSERKLSELGEEVVRTLLTSSAFRLPRVKFEERFSNIPDKVCRDAPAHATVSISLWGLQFEFPEDHFCKDLVASALLLETQIDTLNEFEKLPFNSVSKKKDELAPVLRTKNMLVRNIIVCCFRLLESYLNGIAWDFLMKSETGAEISNNDRRLLTDRGSTFEDKILKYQHRIFHEQVLGEEDASLRYILDVLKPVRDSLMHPSPISDPERFGGRSKLDIIYALDVEHAAWSCVATFQLLQAYEHRRIGRNPVWLAEALEILSVSFLNQSIRKDAWYRVQPAFPS